MDADLDMPLIFCQHIQAVDPPQGSISYTIGVESRIRASSFWILPGAPALKSPPYIVSQAARERSGKMAQKLGEERLRRGGHGPLRNLETTPRGSWHGNLFGPLGGVEVEFRSRDTIYHILLLMVEILHDLKIKNPRNCGSIVCIRSCRIDIMHSRK